LVSGLESAKLKIARAAVHLGEINHLIAEAARNAYEIVKNDAGEEAVRFLVGSPRDVLVIVGEIVYQLRSALDHLAFNLVQSNPTGIPLPKNWERDCTFPLLLSIPTQGSPPVSYSLPVPYEVFEESLPNISKAAYEFIESVQPYRTGPGVHNVLRIIAQLSLNAQNTGVIVVPSEKTKLITDAITVYLHNKSVTRRSGTHGAYRLALENFVDSLRGKRFIQEITASDLIEYQKYLKSFGLSPDTIASRYAAVITFLKSVGVTLSKHDRPKVQKKLVQIYTDEQLERFFAACDESERVLFQFFLMTGLRKSEAVFCAWSDIDLKHGAVRVTSKAEYGFNLKDYAERQVPLPAALIESLQKWRKKSTGVLVFPNSNGKPWKHRAHLLELCKRIARRAGLNEEEFWLHKFRSTFATRCLRAGVDLATVQRWLGHSDLDTVSKYVMHASGAEAKKLIDRVFSATGSSFRS
jgi:integrase